MRNRKIPLKVINRSNLFNFENSLQTYLSHSPVFHPIYSLHKYRQVVKQVKQYSLTTLSNAIIFIVIRVEENRNVSPTWFCKLTS